MLPTGCMLLHGLKKKIKTYLGYVIPIIFMDITTSWKCG